MGVKEKYQSIFGVGKETGRNKVVKREIIYSFLIKIVSVFTGILLVPILIDALDSQRYGVWLVLSSIFVWFSFFDIGLGNGLRNKLAEALARDNRTLAKELVSTTYALVGAIFMVIIIVFTLVNPYINWQSILNTVVVSNDELYLLTSIVFNLFLFRFIFQLIGVIYIADQKPSINNLIFTVGNFIAFILTLIIYKFSQGNLLIYGTLLTGIPLLILILANIISFRGMYKNLSPSWKFVRTIHVRGLLNLGLMFLIIQVAAIILFSTANIIITQLFDPSEVVVYSSALMFYQLPVMVYGIIMAPIWSAVTDAYVRGDFHWLQATLKRLNKISAVFILGIILMTAVSPIVYHLWLGDRVKIPFTLSITMALFAIVNVILAPYTSFINGIGKIKLTVYVVIFSLVIYFPLAILLAKLLNSSAGIMLATCLVNGLGLYFQPMQVNKMLRQEAKGIWNR